MASLAEQLGTTDPMIESVLGRQAPSASQPGGRNLIREYEDPHDQEDIDALLEFQRRFPKDQPPSSAPMIDRVASGVDAEPGGNAFMNWWAKDSTQETFQGIMGAVGATFGGLAGLPMGGGDTSSLERAAVRAAQAPGEARARIQQKKFGAYIDQQLKNETDPRRRDLLMAARAYPQQAAQYLAMSVNQEGPASKEARASRLEELKHGFRMEEIDARNTGGGGLPPTRVDDIESAAAWFRSKPQRLQDAVEETGKLPFELLFDPASIKFIPLLYSPNGGPLYRGPGEVKIDLSGNTTVKDPETGNDMTIGRYEALQAWVAETWPVQDDPSRRFYEYILTDWRNRHGDELSTEGSDVARRLGLE